MPSPNPTLRREYKGAAAGTALQNSMLSTDVTFVLVAANNWPTGAVGKFVVTINRGQADEEKILCDSQSSRNVACLLANRGFDGTTAQSHAAGATVECTISAFDADEWNAHTNATTGVHGIAGAVVGTTDVQNLTNKTLDAASSLGGVTGAQLAADRTAWTAYSPTLTNATLGNGTITGFYQTVGKTVRFRVAFVLGSTSSVGTSPRVSLPAAVKTAADCTSGSLAYKSASDAGYSLTVWMLAGAASSRFATSTGDVTATNPFAWAAGDALLASGEYEAA